MNDAEKIISKMKVFLNSSDLTNTEASLALYDEYLQLNNQIAQRLIQCDDLLQRQQKIHALDLAKQDPDLLKMIELIKFDGLDLLLNLVDLYDWTMPDFISPEVVENLKQAIFEINDLRPLLMEYRRIAKTDQIKYKLQILRQIIQADKNNNEWLISIREVEEQYVKQLIAEAQKVISENNLFRLESIYEELSAPIWHVPIPGIVMTKITKCIEQYRKDILSKKADVILNKIQQAYSDKNNSQLESAINEWQNLCKSSFIPDEAANKQYQNALNYLQTSKAKALAEVQFNDFIELLLKQLNELAPLEQIENTYYRLTALGLPIPQDLIKRVLQYRNQYSRQQNIKKLLTFAKASALILIALLILIYGIKLLHKQSIIEEYAIKLQTALANPNEEKAISEAESIIKKYELKYPFLITDLTIAVYKDKLTELKSERKKVAEEKEKKERNRVEEFNENYKYIEGKIQENSIDKILLQERINDLAELAILENEKNQVEKLKKKLQQVINKYDSFHKNKLADIKKDIENFTNQIYTAIRNNDLGKAQLLIDELSKTINKLYEIPSEFCEQSDIQKHIEFKNSLSNEIINKQNEIIIKNDICKQLKTASTIFELENIMKDYENRLKQELKEPDLSMKTILERDIFLFKQLLGIQSHPNSNSDLPTSFSRMMAAKDSQEKALEEKKKKLIKKFKEFNDIPKIYFFRIQLRHETDKFYDYYVTSFGQINNTTWEFNSIDNKVIKLKRSKNNNKYYRIEFEDSEMECTIIQPKILNHQSLRESVAHHTKHINKIYKKLNNINNDEFFSECLMLLKEVAEDQYCSPYWKMLLFLTIIPEIKNFDNSNLGILAKLERELSTIYDKSASVESPLMNEYLNADIQKIIASYDMDKLIDCINLTKQYNQIRDLIATQDYNILTVVTRINGKIEYSINSKLSSNSGDVFYFDQNTGDCIYAGSYDGNQIILDQKTSELIEGRILFTTKKAHSITDYYNELIKKNLNMQQINWPEFWPINLRGK